MDTGVTVIDVDAIKRSPSNIFLLWDGPRPTDYQLGQIFVCLRSIKLHEPDRQAYLFSNILEPFELFDTSVYLVRWNLSSLSHCTPLANAMPNADSNWTLWSDVFRLLCLWRWGGTYFDVDDILIRPLPGGQNLMAACPLGTTPQETWPHTVIPIGYCKDKAEIPDEVTSGFRFGNDPMINFDAENTFLFDWIRRIPTTERSNWGQVLPTELFAASPNRLQEDVTPTLWSDLLYHPYDSGHFRHDQRYPGNFIPIWERVNHEQYKQRWNLIKSRYHFPLVKNHAFGLQIKKSVHVQDSAIQPMFCWAIQELWNELNGSKPFDANI